MFIDPPVLPPVVVASFILEYGSWGGYTNVILSVFAIRNHFNLAKIQLVNGHDNKTCMTDKSGT